MYYQVQIIRPPPALLYDLVCVWTPHAACAPLPHIMYCTQVHVLVVLILRTSKRDMYLYVLMLYFLKYILVSPRICLVQTLAHVCIYYRCGIFKAINEKLSVGDGIHNIERRIETKRIIYKNLGTRVHIRRFILYGLHIYKYYRKRVLDRPTPIPECQVRVPPFTTHMR